MRSPASGRAPGSTTPYFVGDYAGLDFAPDGSDEGFKPFQVRANDPLDRLNRTDVFATTATRSP